MMSTHDDRAIEILDDGESRTLLDRIADLEGHLEAATTRNTELEKRLRNGVDAAGQTIEEAKMAVASAHEATLKNAGADATVGDNEMEQITQKLETVSAALEELARRISIARGSVNRRIAQSGTRVRVHGRQPAERTKGSTRTASASRAQPARRPESQRSAVAPRSPKRELFSVEPDPPVDDVLFDQFFADGDEEEPSRRWLLSG